MPSRKQSPTCSLLVHLGRIHRNLAANAPRLSPAFSPSSWGPTRKPQLSSTPASALLNQDHASRRRSRRAPWGGTMPFPRRWPAQLEKTPRGGTGAPARFPDGTGHAKGTKSPSSSTRFQERELGQWADLFFVFWYADLVRIAMQHKLDLGSAHLFVTSPCRACQSATCPSIVPRETLLVQHHPTE